jgi:hypothetical protein
MTVGEFQGYVIVFELGVIIGILLMRDTFRRK